MSTKRYGCAAAFVGGHLCVVGGDDENGNRLLSAEIYITAPAKVPSTIVDRVIALEEQLGLDGGPSLLVKRVELLEVNIFGNVQNGSESLAKRISIMEEGVGLS